MVCRFSPLFCLYPHTPPVFSLRERAVAFALRLLQNVFSFRERISLLLSPVISVARIALTQSPVQDAMGSDHSHTRSPASRSAAMNTEEAEVSTLSSPQSVHRRQSRQGNLKSRLQSVGDNETHFRDTCSHTKFPSRPSTRMRHWGPDKRGNCVKNPSFTSRRERERRSDSPRVSKCLPAGRPSLPGLRALSLEAITLKDRRRKLQGTSRSPRGEAGFRNSDRKSDCIPDDFASALRRAVKEKKPSTVAVLLRSFPGATVSRHTVWSGVMSSQRGGMRESSSIVLS